MTWKNVSKALLFLAGMVASLGAGHLFYLERFVAGGCFFALTALFLFYTVAEIRVGPTEPLEGALDFEVKKALANLSVLAAENALNGAKRIGRTMPCTPKEINELEETLVPLLVAFGVDRKERERLTQEFDKLRARSRHDEGRRALSHGRL